MTDTSIKIPLQREIHPLKRNCFGKYMNFKELKANQKSSKSPGQVARLVGAPSGKPKDCGFNLVRAHT